MNRQPDESFNHGDKPIGLGVLLTNLGSPRVCSVAGCVRTTPSFWPTGA
jgi:hypothetical protein